jgi:hypothetical protein
MNSGGRQVALSEINREMGQFRPLKRLEELGASNGFAKEIAHLGIDKKIAA